MVRVDYALLIGLGAIAAIYALNGLLSGSWRLSAPFLGADNRPSTSKFQWWLWIWVIAFVYVTVFAARCLAAGAIVAVPEDIPENVLWVLGLSTGTMVLSKGLTSSQAESGKIVKSAAAGKGPGAGALVQDDENHPDLAKLQFFVWTLIAVAVYLARLVGMVLEASRRADCGGALSALGAFPDIDGSLLILSGLSSSGYLGAKMVTRNAPSLQGLAPSSLRAGEGGRLLILGNNLGVRLPGSLVVIGPRLVEAGLGWANDRIELELPAGLPAGSYEVSAIAFGVKTNELRLELT